MNEELAVGTPVHVYGDKIVWHITMLADMDGRYSVTDPTGHTEYLLVRDLRPIR